MYNYEILFIIALVALLISIVINVRQWQHFTQLLKTLDDYRNIMALLRRQQEIALTEWRRLDKLGAYETNDELEVFFKSIKEQLSIIDSYFTD